MAKAGYALITAGSTSVRLTPTRRLIESNDSRLAVCLVHRLLNLGISVVLVRSEDVAQRHELDPRIRQYPFETGEEYIQAIQQAAREADHALGRPRFAFSAATISDSLPEVAEPVEPTARRQVWAKEIDSWRERFGRQCYIVGFKNDVPALTETPIAAAGALLRRARLNLVVASNPAHDASVHLLIKPDGGWHRLDGPIASQAETLAAFCVRSASTHWASSRAVGTLSPDEIGARPHCAAAEMLDFGRRANLLKADANGNATSRAAQGRLDLWTTPRGRPDKSRLTAADLILAVPDLEDRRIRFRSDPAAPPEKPSIDTYVNALLYDALPELQSTLHFHNAWALDAGPRTRLDWPCGSAEEAGAIEEAVARWRTARPDRAKDGSLMVELSHHGHLLLSFDHHTTLKHLAFAWAMAEAAYWQHLKEIGQEAERPKLAYTPIFRREDIIGLCATHRDGWNSFYLLPGARGYGTGELLARLIDARRALVGVHRDCKVEDWYRDRGFRVVRRDGDLAVLEPPSRRDDLIGAATMRIRCATTGRLLLLRRGHEPWLDHWANPGGCFQPGSDSSPWATACRETKEELGLDLSRLTEPPPESRSVHISRGVTPDGYERTYRTTCYHVDVLREYVPTIDPEEVREARWFTPEEARSLLMARGTREALRFSMP